MRVHVDALAVVEARVLLIIRVESADRDAEGPLSRHVVAAVYRSVARIAHGNVALRGEALQC